MYFQNNIEPDRQSPQLINTLKPPSPSHSLRTNNSVIQMKFATVGKQMALINGNAQLWNLTRGKLIRSLKIFEYNDTELALSTDNREIAFGRSNVNQYITLWCTITGRVKQIVKDESIKIGYFACNNTTLDYSPCGRYLIYGNDFGVIGLWDSQINIQYLHMCLQTPIVCIRFSRNGQQIVLSKANQTIQILNSKTFKLEQNIKYCDYLPNTYLVAQLAYSIDNQEIISVIGGEIKIWNVEFGTERIYLENPYKGVINFSMSKDDKQILYTGEDVFGICDFQTGIVLWEIQQQLFIKSSIYSKNSPQIALGYSDGVIRLYRTD